MIRSLIDTYRHVGWLPDCRMTFNKGYTQGGSNADNVLADALLKGLKDGIDWEVGFQAVVKDAEEEPFDWGCQGRGGLDSWKSLGYVPAQDFDYKVGADGGPFLVGAAPNPWFSLRSSGCYVMDSVPA